MQKGHFSIQRSIPICCWRECVSRCVGDRGGGGEAGKKGEGGRRGKEGGKRMKQRRTKCRLRYHRVSEREREREKKKKVFAFTMARVMGVCMMASRRLQCEYRRCFDRIDELISLFLHRKHIEKMERRRGGGGGGGGGSRKKKQTF